MTDQADYARKVERIKTSLMFLLAVGWLLTSLPFGELIALSLFSVVIAWFAWKL